MPSRSSPAERARPLRLLGAVAAALAAAVYVARILRRRPRAETGPALVSAGDEARQLAPASRKGPRAGRPLPKGGG